MKSSSDTPFDAVSSSHSILLLANHALVALRCDVYQQYSGVGSNATTSVWTLPTREQKQRTPATQCSATQRSATQCSEMNRTTPFYAAARYCSSSPPPPSSSSPSPSSPPPPGSKSMSRSPPASSVPPSAVAAGTVVEREKGWRLQA